MVSLHPQSGFAIRRQSESRKLPTDGKAGLRMKNFNPFVTLSTMLDPLSEITAPWLRRFRQSLKRWHAQHGRDLPWRNCRDPYKVWISEIMLQQTTVVAVKPYFDRFLKRFPNVAVLASANEEDVLRLWEGLGYYSRARNLHRAARALVEQGGSFPETVEELRQLPGIGRYTAGAIVSFAFDRPAPILEANTLRLYSRLLGYRDDPRSTAGQRLLWSFAEKLVPMKAAGEFNQALTDLGATVCAPTDPRCDDCPVAARCRALADQSQADIPRPARRPEITAVHEASIAIESDGNFLLIRRPEGARWAGLWDFPRLEIHPTELASVEKGPLHNSQNEKLLPSQSRRKQEPRPVVQKPSHHRGKLGGVNDTAHLEQRIATEFGLTVNITNRLTQLKHSVTRYRITLDCWHADCAARTVTTDLPTAWVTATDFARYPLSVTGRKLADLIMSEQNKHG